MVDLGGYVIIVCENKDRKVKLYVPKGLEASAMPRIEKLGASRSSISQHRSLNFSEYDFIGFDLDHTLATYNLKNLLSNHFTYLVSVLNCEKGYEIENKLTPKIVDFISRGLVIDIERGNLLKVAFDGEIVRASHGTRPLGLTEIARIYPKRQWAPLKETIEKKFSTWKSRENQMYCFMDFTDAATSGVYALAIDSGKNEKTVWSDVIYALRKMYSDNHWSSNIFKMGNPYVHKTSSSVLNWVSQLRTVAKVALITSNWYEFVPRIAECTLGPNWQSLFDFCVFNSKKPTFFTDRSNFLDLNGKETTFTLSGNYNRGSIHVVIDALAKDLNRPPKCVYIGDSPRHDFWFTTIDYIAITEELKAEGIVGSSHPSGDFLTSTFWGSYVYENAKPTLFGKATLDGVFCAPDLEYFADKPIDHIFENNVTAEITASK